MILEIVLFGIASFLVVKWATKNYDFFQKRGIKYVKPYLFIGTNKWIYPRKNIVEYVNEYYKMFPNDRIFGLFDFRKPLYVIRDPELIKHLAIREFDNFPNHMGFIDTTHDEFFGSMLSTMRDKKWKEMRNSLSPVFTGSKMRQMFELMSEVGHDMTDYFWEEYSREGPIAYDVKKTFSRFTNDVIATCAFGLKCDSFRHPENEFFDIGKQFVKFAESFALVRMLFIQNFPKLAKFLGLKFFSQKSIDKFYSMIIENMNHREKEKIYRPDMIHLLMQLRKGELNYRKDGNDDDDDDDDAERIDSIAAVKEVASGGNSTKKATWSDMEIIAQCFLFFIAGFETTANTMRYLTYELALNPDIQEKLIAEIDELHESLDGKPLSYEKMQSMKYLDMVISETLRKWPPAFVTDRQCGRDFKYEDDSGLRFEMKKDMIFWIPIYPLHMDGKYFPNPEKFDPERFSDENRHSINFDAFMPFGIGPRNCIGSRFALMEVKVAVYHLLLKFKFEVCDETPIPLKLKKSFNALLPEKDIKLHFTPRESE